MPTANDRHSSSSESRSTPISKSTLANRASAKRHDVTDEVMAEHRATFEPPAAEQAITIDGRDVLDPSNLLQVMRAIRTKDMFQART